MKLWYKIIIAIISGIISGFILGPYAAVFKPVGTLFLSLLNMLIVPLVFSSMVLGITRFPSAEKLGKIGSMTIVLYVVTSIFAIILGLFFSNLCSIGSEMHMALPQAQQNVQTLELSDLLLQIVPKNPIRAFAEGNILQIIFYAIFCGYSLYHLEPAKRNPVIQFIEGVLTMTQKMTHAVMAISPFGVFALMATATGTFGLQVLYPLMKFLLSYYAAVGIYIGVVYCGIIGGIARLKIAPFFKGVAPAMLTAASTCSSSATLSTTIECAIERLGISKHLAQFVLPLGSSLNMNGSALFQAMAAVFIAQAYGIELTLTNYFTLASCIILATLGTASLPSAGIIMMSVVFNSVGIPIEGIALLASVDRLRDMVSSTLNVTGDLVCALYVARCEDELDVNQYMKDYAAAKSLT